MCKSFMEPKPDIWDRISFEVIPEPQPVAVVEIINAALQNKNQDRDTAPWMNRAARRAHGKRRS